MTIELAAPDDLEPMWADQTRLTQMFDNLISNAVKFTPPGGTIGVTLSGAEDMVSAQIADTGIGIPAGEVDRLFERFFRASTVGAVDGTGLGLSIVKSIVEVHDGTIAVTQHRGCRHDVHDRAAGPAGPRHATPRRRPSNEHGRRRRPSR